MIEDISKKGWFFGEGGLSSTELLNVFQSFMYADYEIKKNILTPNKQSHAKISLSKVYGLNAYPFHTDGVQFEIPPRFLVLKYKSRYKNSTKTLMIDGFDLASINKNLFYNSIFFIRGNNYKELSPLINKRKKNGQAILRYNPVIMDSVLKKKKKELNQLIDDSNKIEIEWFPNTCLIVDNWRMLHAREAVTNQNNERTIERIEYYIR